MGSALYAFVGQWVPTGLVGRMMASGRGSGRILESGEWVGGEGSPVKESSSPVKEERIRGLGESEYVSVYGEVSRDDLDVNGGEAFGQ